MIVGVLLPNLKLMTLSAFLASLHFALIRVIRKGTTASLLIAEQDKSIKMRMKRGKSGCCGCICNSSQAVIVVNSVKLTLDVVTFIFPVWLILLFDKVEESSGDFFVSLYYNTALSEPSEDFLLCGALKAMSVGGFKKCPTMPQLTCFFEQF